MKQYKLEVVIHEDNDDFWETLKGKTGCDEVHAWIKGLLTESTGLEIDGEYTNCELRIIEYKDE